MVHTELSYNPYLLETIVSFNGQAPRINSQIDTWMFFKWVFKAFIAVYLVTNTFNIVMAVFDVGQHLVNSAAGVIGGNTAIDITDTIATMETEMETMEIGELITLAFETLLISLCMKIISILITVD